MKKVFETILGIYFFIVVYLASFLMHTFTAYCVYDSYGAFLGIIAFMSPVVSTIIMMILYTIFYGLFNGFNIIVVIYLLLYIPIILLYWIISKLEKKEQKNQPPFIIQAVNNIQANYCTECGTKLEDKASFCYNCGNKIKE